MKLTIIYIMLAAILNANIEVKQNMRALYKGVELSEVQENYILDNQDKNIEILKRFFQKETKQFKNLNDKSVVTFILTPAGEINDIKFLKTSNNRKLDRATKKAIKKSAKKLLITKEKVELRYIISYTSQRKAYYSNYTKSNNTQRTREEYYQPISNGTTRFQHSSKEYVRVFETRRDGFVNASASPQTCITFKLLTYENQIIHTGYAPWQFNKEIPKGKYKLLIKTKQTCDVHLQYK